MWFIVRLGSGLELHDKIIYHNTSENHWGAFLGNLLESFASPFAILLVQIIVVLIVARLLGFLFKKI